jgi:FemAB-related protein (PEP-CTERM system-associated)
MTDISDLEWDVFVESHASATFFHRSAWRSVARDVFGHVPHYLGVRKGGTLSAVLPLVEVRSRLFGHALISNAFCVGGGPLADDVASLADVLAQAEEVGRRVGAEYVELRDTPRAGGAWLARDDLYAGFAAPLPADEEENLKQIPRKQRAVVRKAIAQGLTTRIEGVPKTFFDLYARTMRDHGTPALPRRFFDKVTTVFGGDCEVLTVFAEDRPLSSVLSYFFRDRVLPYYTGSHPDARRTGANDLMYWALMRRAAERGCTVFDFGRSKVGTGPYSFKRNWGFEPRAIAHQYRLLKRTTLPNVSPTNPHYAVLIEAWRRLPLPVANAISPMLSRNLA